jgi:pimeloyl-ACP methyl ester carboxylesterase
VRGVRDAGDPRGLPVIYHHGTPQDGELLDLWTDDAAAKGLRLIGFDRAGYGASPRRPDRDVASAAADVEALADELGIDRFATWGVSGGGPHALACAALLPDRVVAAAAVGSPAPHDADDLDWLAGMGEGNVVEFGAAMEDADALRPLLAEEADARGDVTGEELVSAWASLLAPPDAAALATGSVADFLAGCMRRAFAAGVDGWLDDDLAFVRPWGFDLASIRVPTLVVHGGQDAFVPAAHARWLASRIPGCESWIHDEEAHISLYLRVPEVHGWLGSRF